MPSPIALYEMFVEALHAIPYEQATGQPGDWIPPNWDDLPEYEHQRWVNFRERLAAI